jgi:hypothetical protein
MASTARGDAEKGFRVSGSDENVYPPMSTLFGGAKDPGDVALRGTKPFARP